MYIAPFLLTGIAAAGIGYVAGFRAGRESAEAERPVTGEGIVRLSDAPRTSAPPPPKPRG